MDDRLVLVAKCLTTRVLCHYLILAVILLRVLD